MKFTIPQPLQDEHEAVHERLRQTTEAGGEVGEAAETLTRLMHPHLYPAAILVGQVVWQRLGVRAAELA